MRIYACILYCYYISVPFGLLAVKVDVHINNGSFGKTHTGNGHTGRSEIMREAPSEHAYEQICLRQEETSSVGSSSNKKVIDNASDSR
ncbi:hypothetical protein HZH66_010518 [Vespula vulgaris]|uniref:Uncharacterized protein n=1 Tax=Vespula vulgaris TaxID=7454 RepID=A0A834JLV7_VESVU|nr:hypothetical protein HZH66_010518 [Vespula vulgaris]